MSKLCHNGHQFEEVWEMCPYCQHTGSRNSSIAQPTTTRTNIGGPAAYAVNRHPDTIRIGDITLKFKCL